jgi:hypothetical protein
MKQTACIRTKAPWRVRTGAIASLAFGLLLSGCGSSPSSLTGTAATGAPIVGGTVEVACSTGSPLSATTSDTGAWTVTLSDQTLPCKVRVSGGQVNGAANTQSYHSVATEAGTVNITPLTDLAVAQMAQQDPATWFNQRAATDFTAMDAAKVTAAVKAVVDNLGLADYLGSDDPLKTAFTAKVQATDKIDKALEALKAADAHGSLLIAAKSPNFTSLALSYKTAILAVLMPQPGGEGGGGSGDTGSGSGSGGTSGGDSGGTGSGGGTGGGSGGSGNGGSGIGALTCNDPTLSGNNGYRTPSAEEVGIFVGANYFNFDNYEYDLSLAEDGKLTVRGETYMPTGLCLFQEELFNGTPFISSSLAVFFQGGVAYLSDQAYYSIEIRD